MLHKAPPKPPVFPMAPGQTGPMPGALGGPDSAPFGLGPPPAPGMMPPGGMPPMPMRTNIAEGPPAQAPFASGPGGFGRPDHAPPPPQGGGMPPAPEPRRDPREDRYGGGRDPRNRDPRAGMGRADPRAGPSGGRMQPGGGGNLPPHLAGADPEKAQLIMQVLKLSDAQIAMLPADQRASIMELKKQIHTSQ
jgi:cleavage stimulation factor subunit 2